MWTQTEYLWFVNQQKHFNTCFNPVCQWALNQWPWAPQPLLSRPLELSFCLASWWVTCQLQLRPSHVRLAWPRPSQRAQVRTEVSLNTHLCSVFKRRPLLSLFCPCSVGAGGGGGGGGSAPQPVVPTPKDKSGAPPVRSIHDDLVTVGTPLSAHRQVSTVVLSDLLHLLTLTVSDHLTVCFLLLISELHHQLYVAETSAFSRRNLPADSLISYPDDSNQVSGLHDS